VPQFSTSAQSRQIASGAALVSTLCSYTHMRASGQIILAQTIYAKTIRPAATDLPVVAELHRRQVLGPNHRPGVQFGNNRPVVARCARSPGRLGQSAHRTRR
jgi:hypothetical protein